MTSPELDRMLSNLDRAKAKLWAHARAEHRAHSPKPEYPTEYLSCLREPCKTIREAIWGDGSDA